MIACLLNPIYQFTNILGSMFWLIYNLAVVPNKSKIQHKVETGNEIALYILSYFYLIWSEWNSSYDNRYFMGWVFIWLFLALIAGNFGFLIFKLVSGIVMGCKKKKMLKKRKALME